MKKIIIIALFSTIASMAQIKGNKKIVTRSFNAENIKAVKIDLHADILIDASLEEGVTITTDSNLFDHIAKETINGELHFDQLKWIEPTNGITIKVGAPFIKYIEQDAHDTVEIINLDSAYLEVIGSLGKIKLAGKVAQLEAKIRNGKVDAKNLSAKKATIISTGRGRAIINVTEELNTNLKNVNNLELVREPKKILGNYKTQNAKKSTTKKNNIAWIPLKIKNNSFKWNRFVVVGPKKNEDSFSYGFSLLPGFSKKEIWSNGTKVYKLDNEGNRELLVTINAEDKGKTVKLF